MPFVALGVACLLLYSVMAVYMTAAARRDPRRTFRVGEHGRIKRRDVTGTEWIRRYLPWGLGGGVLLLVLGLFLTSHSH